MYRSVLSPARPRLLPGLSSLPALPALLALALLLLALPAQGTPTADPGVTPVDTDAAATAEGELLLAARTTTRRVSRATRVRRATNIAVNQIGDPYRYGAAGPNAFDCSGLVYFATHRAGLTGVPRTSRAQAGHVRRIARANMRRGDLVFFTGSSGVYHVGIYLGWRNGRRLIVHSPSPGKRVRRDPIWSDRWFAGTLR